MRLAFAIFGALFALALPAAAQIERPRLGFMLDSRGSLRPVTGEAAAATLGDPAGDPAGGVAITFACTAKLCLAKKDRTLVDFVPDRPQASRVSAVPEGAALIAIDHPASPAAAPGAWIYFQAVQRLARWHDGVLDFADFAPNGVVLSLRAADGGFDYAIARRRAVWIEHYSVRDRSTMVLDSAGAGPPVMLIDGGILLAPSNRARARHADQVVLDEVVLRRPDGHELTFPLAGPTKFQAAGDGYVEITARDGLWILRTNPGHEQLFLLPGTPE